MLVSGCKVIWISTLLASLGCLKDIKAYVYDDHC